MRNRKFSSDLTRQILSLILLTGVLSGAFSAFGQKKSVKTNQPKTPSVDNQNKNCNGGWSGIVTFTKTRSYTHDTGKTKSASFGTETHKKYSEEYKYTGRIVVDGSQNPRSLITNSQVTLTDVRKTWSRFDQRDSCFYDGIDGQVPQWTEKNESDITNAFGEGAADFWMNVNELRGIYSFSFRFPQANGTNDRTYDKTAGGWCNPEFNKPEKSANKFPGKVDGEGAEISDQKIDPARPDVLSGSKTWETGGTPSTKTTFTVTWGFKRCPAPVEVTDIRFDDHPYPDHTTWKEIETTRGTVDGNRVRIRATVTNFSGETRFPTVKFNELVENWVLPEGEKNIRLEPGESREIELEWDTSGYAWQGKGYDGESYRKIKVEAIDETRMSELTKLIVVNPRPVVLAHGLWSNAAAWNGYDKFFEEGHSKAWKSYAVGANPSVAKMDTGERFGNTAQTKSIGQNAVELDKQIEFVRKDLNAWHVDIVAHSMGGLIARYYIAERMPINPLSTKPVVTKLIMLGTPNQGSPCAALMYAAYAAKGDRIRALWELIPRNVLKFNESYSNRRGVRFSALAGKAIPTTCQEPTRGDGVVSIGSARWMVKDWRYSESLAHTELTSRADFGAFVFPRLAIGPRGNHDHEILSAENDAEQNENFSNLQRGDVISGSENGNYDALFRNISYENKDSMQSDDAEEMDEGGIEGLTMAKEIKLQANQTTEVEIPMQTAANGASIVFVASPNVSATLVDAAGKVVGKNASGTAESKQMFRTIAVEKTVAPGVWKLKLESKETAETNVFLAAFAETDSLVFQLSAGKASASKQIPLTAKLTDNNSLVTGAIVKAKLHSENGQTTEIVLLDDGAHGDGAANDGVYGATTGAQLADGDYLVEAKAETNSKIRFALASFKIGAEKPVPSKQTTKQAKK